MPTGYTADILEGKITTLSQFAKRCMRNFGATMHMRDFDLNAEYVPRKPSAYYKKEIAKAKKEISRIKNLTIEEIISEKVKSLKESQEYHLKAIEKANSDRSLLETLLKEAKEFAPPTAEHQGVKDFMIQQLETTIDFDCGTDYHTKKLAEIQNQLENLDSDSILKDLTEKAKKTLDYFVYELEKEVARCKESNVWVEKLLGAINN